MINSVSFIPRQRRREKPEGKGEGRKRGEKERKEREKTHDVIPDVHAFGSAGIRTPSASNAGPMLNAHRMRVTASHTVREPRCWPGQMRLSVDIISSMRGAEIERWRTYQPKPNA